MQGENISVPHAGMELLSYVGSCHPLGLPSPASLMDFRQHLSLLCASQFGRGTFLGHLPSSYSSGTLAPGTTDPYLYRVRTGHTCFCTTGVSSGLQMFLTWHAFLVVLLSQAFTQHPPLESTSPPACLSSQWDLESLLFWSAQHSASLAC